VRRLALLSATVLATLAGALALWELRAALVLVLLAIATSAAVRPFVDFWTARRVPTPVALGLTWVLGLALPALLLVWLATGAIVDDLRGTGDGLLRLHARIGEEWPAGNAAQRAIAARLPSTDVTATLATTDLSDVVRRGVGLGVNVFSALGGLAIVLVLSIFWTANRDMFERLWLSLVPVDQRPSAQETWLAIKEGVGAKLRTDVLESALAGALLYAGYAAIGLEHPLLPAVAGGVLRLVPLVGWLLALLTTLVAGLVTDPTVAVVAAGYTAVVMIGLEAVVAPRLLRSRRYSSLLLTVLVLALADAYGVVGIVVAPALAAAIQIFFEKRLASARTPLSPRPSTAELGERLERLDRLMAAPGLATAPALVSVVERLTALIAATEEATGERGGLSVRSARKVPAAPGRTSLKRVLRDGPPRAVGRA
jgi:putative permease